MFLLTSGHLMMLTPEKAPSRMIVAEQISDLCRGKVPQPIHFDTDPLTTDPRNAGDFS